MSHARNYRLVGHRSPPIARLPRGKVRRASVVAARIQYVAGLFHLIGLAPRERAPLVVDRRAVQGERPQCREPIGRCSPHAPAELRRPLGFPAPAVDTARSLLTPNTARYTSPGAPHPCTPSALRAAERCAERIVQAPGGVCTASYSVHEYRQTFCDKQPWHF